MTTKYLEIDSTYRDRNLWPSPGSFQVLLSQSGRLGAETAVDPVSNAAPIRSWTGQTFQIDLNPTPAMIGSVETNGVGAASSPTTIILRTAVVSAFQEDPNYYINSVLVANNIRTRITGYTFLGNNRGQFTVSPPIELEPGDLVSITDPTDVRVNRIFVPNGSRVDGAYIGCLLYNETVDEYLTIDSYDATTGLVHAPGSMVGWANNHTYSIRCSDAPVNVGAIQAGSTASSLVLDTPATVGSFIRIRGDGILPATPPTNESRRVVGYDSVTMTATVAPPFTAAPPVGRSYEVLGFSHDNFTPFVYTGSKQQGDATYTIKLNSLVIPNGILTSGGGGRIEQQPYVYVELSPIDSYITNLCCSNNPNSTKMLFRASYSNFDKSSDTTTPSFVHLIGDEMKQRVRFMVETNLRFRVLMSNGETLRVSGDETQSPLAPNPNIQISALFECKRSSAN